MDSFRYESDKVMLDQRSERLRMSLSDHDSHLFRFTVKISTWIRTNSEEELINMTLNGCLLLLFFEHDTFGGGDR